MKKIRVGLIGCGMISHIYIKNITGIFSAYFELVGCYDLLEEARNNCAKSNNIIAFETLESIIKAEGIDLILNLTIPAVHYKIAKMALLAGKHTYSEKPLATTLVEGEYLVQLAREKGLAIGAAPDTFLGGGLQTCKRLLEKGIIGKAVSARGTLLSKGPESFHPNPEFFYLDGAGPLLDMGPYYITALVALLGPIKRVVGFANNDFKKRTITEETRANETFTSEVDTSVSAMMEFEDGAVAHMVTSWDFSWPYWKSGTPLLEIFGTKGSIILPDPNTFCGITDEPMSKVGDYILLRTNSDDYSEYPISKEYIDNSRGLGLVQIAKSITGNKSAIVDGTLSLHILEILLGILESSKSNKIYRVKNLCEKPIAYNEES